MADPTNHEEGFDETEELEVVEFEDEDGTLHTAAILAVVAVEGHDYAVLAPVAQLEDDSDEMEIFLFQYGEDEDGNEMFGYIEDEAVFKLVQQAATTLLGVDEDEEEYIN